MKALSMRRFWHLTLLLFLGTFYGVYMASVYKTTAQGFLSDSLLTTVGSLGAVCNGGSRIMWAAL